MLHYEASNEHIQRSVMLTSEIPGHPLGPTVDRADAQRIVVEAGHDLARINSILVEGFGWVRRGMTNVPDHLTAAHSTHQAFILEEIDAHLAALSSTILTEKETADVRSVLRDYGSWLDEPDSRLAHGDFDTSHICVHDGAYAGIIDFGEIRGASPLYDLGHHQMHDGERLPYATLPFLLEGHTDVTPLPLDHRMRIVFLSLLIAIRAAGRGLQRAPDSRIIRTATSALRRDMRTLANST